MSLDTRLQQIWYGERSLCSLVLLPLSMLFGAIVCVRRTLYRKGVLASVSVDKPVVVVGNITVGGTGKTPLVIWLANELASRGLKIGIVNRGYGGRAREWPQDVSAMSDPNQVGDEAVVLARRTKAIIVSGPDRVAAARRAIERGADVVISDDGLQHYRLRHNCEFAVFDASRMAGNGRLLPAGPLREPLSRINSVDAVVINGSGDAPAQLIDERRTVRMQIELTSLTAVTSAATRSLTELRGSRVHAVAAIGHPERFFAALRAQGLEVDARPLPDHAPLRAADVTFDDALPVLMTEKDAVKCQGFANERHWAVAADANFSAAHAARLLSIVEQAIDRVQ